MEVPRVGAPLGYQCLEVLPTKELVRPFIGIAASNLVGTPHRGEVHEGEERIEPSEIFANFWRA